MSYGGYIKSEHICCDRCEKDIVYNDGDMYDFISFRGVIDKLIKHQQEDKACLRVQKLHELLDGEDDL